MASAPGPTIDDALVRHVAELASLSLSEDEARALGADLARIVGYIAQLDEVDVTGVEPTAHVLVERLPWRDDAPQPCLSRDEALSQAPRTEGDGFAVPAFVEEK